MHKLQSFDFLLKKKKIQIKEICTPFTTIFTLYTKKEKSNTEVKQKFEKCK